VTGFTIQILPAEAGLVCPAPVVNTGAGASDRAAASGRKIKTSNPLWEAAIT